MLMTIRENWLLLPLCGVFAVSMLSGCEDAEARKRTQVQEKLDSAVSEFRQAEFGRVVSELTPVSGGGPGQQAARGLLLSDSLREVGVIPLADAERLELEQRGKRDRLRGNLAGLLRLEASATALAAASTEPIRAELHGPRDALDGQIRDLNRQIAELEAPISERRANIDRDLREVERLRGQADDLFRRAMDLGHADGLDSFKQATALRREADQVERRIALVEIELMQGLEPRRDGAAMALEHAKSMQEAARTTLQELDEFDRIYKEQITNLQGKVEELRRTINDGVRALAATSSGEIEPLYEQAVSQFERAASEASRAAGEVRAESGAARLTEARCREALGRAHWSRARGLADHMALLSSLVAAGPAVGNVEGYSAQLEAATAKHREFVELAKAAYEGAITAVEQAPGRVEGGDAYRFTLQAAVDLLSGREVDRAVPTAPEIGMELGEVPFDPAMLEGLAEAGGKEELLAMLDQMDFDTDKQMLEGMGIGDPNMMEMMREPYARAVTTIRERVERGEITNAAQLHQALIDEMTKAMGG